MFLTLQERQKDDIKNVALEQPDDLQLVFVEHHDNLRGKLPEETRRIRGSFEDNKLEEQYRNVLAQGLIRLSQSLFGAPTPFVLKGGCWKMCIDCRALNTQKVKHRFPLHRIVMFLDKLVLSKVFTKSYPAPGYHQIVMKDIYIYRTGVHHSYEVMGAFRYVVRAVQLVASNTSTADGHAFVAEIY